MREVQACPVVPRIYSYKHPLLYKVIGQGLDLKPIPYIRVYAIGLVCVGSHIGYMQEG